MYNEHKSNKDEYWFQNINILLDTNKLGMFLPTSDMTYTEKSNALVRGSIFLGLGLSLFLKKYLYLYIPIFMMCFTYIMYLLRRVDNESNDNINNILQSQNKTISENTHAEQVRQSHLNLHTNQKNINEKFRNSKYMKALDGIDHNEFKNQENIRDNNWRKRDCLESTSNNPFMNPNPFSSRNIGPNCSPLSEDTKNKINLNFNKNLFKDANDIFNHRNGDRQFYTVPGNTFPNDRDTFMKWCYSKPKTCKEGNGSQCVANNYHRLRGPHTGATINN